MRIVCDQCSKVTFQVWFSSKDFFLDIVGNVIHLSSYQRAFCSQDCIREYHKKVRESDKEEN